jgi:VWFA-related protein
MLRVTVLTAFTVLLFAAAATMQTPPPSSQLRILFPAASAALSGRVLLRAELTPPVADAAVVFFGDGRQLCEVRMPPYECDWDAGTAITEHVVRVVATLPGGGRLTDNVRTADPRRSDSVALFSVGIDAVQLAVNVDDEAARERGILPQSAFHVFEDGAAQQISSFAAADAPLDLVVAVDTSASMTPAVPSLKRAVLAFLDAVPMQASVSVLAFGNELIDVAARTASREERRAGVGRLAAYGTTRLYDAIIHSIDALKPGQGRKAVIVFTDGEDEGSRASLQDVERRLEATDVTLYMIGQGRGETVGALQKVMTRLVEPTGGRALFTRNIDQLGSAFRELLDELSRQYLVAYTPSDATRDGRWRRIRVTVDGHRRIRTRAGYRLTATP